MKVAFFFPEHLRLDGSNPAYEVYLDKENRQFITYNSLIQKWSESKLDKLDWKRQYWYTKAYWISDEDETSIQAYLNINKKAVEAIRQFQRDVRDEQLETSGTGGKLTHGIRIWNRCRSFQRTGAAGWIRLPFGKITFTTTIKRAAPKQVTVPTAKRKCGSKYIPITINRAAVFAARHPVVFKAYGRAGYMQTEKHFAYLIQRCKDGFVVREFQADRTYGKESLPKSKLYCQEIRRTIYDRERKQEPTIGVCINSEICAGFPEAPVLIVGLVRMMDGFMAKHCQLWNSRNFDAQGSSTGFGSRKAFIRKNIWLCSNGYLKWNRSAR